MYMYMYMQHCKTLADELRQAATWNRTRISIVRLVYGVLPLHYGGKMK